MQNNVDAVIAALRVALEEAEEAVYGNWPVKSANRWINQLPGAWFGRWRHLKISSDEWDGNISRDRFIGHVKATIAYLETNKEEFERTGVGTGRFRHHPRGISRSRLTPTSESLKGTSGTGRYA